MQNDAFIENTSGGGGFPRWRAKIDWLSYTDPSLASADPYKDQSDVSINVHTHLLSISLGDPALYWKLTQCAAVGAGRTGYRYSIRYDVGITLFFESAVAPPLVEVSGAGCDFLFQHINLAALAAHHSERVSRLDLAADLETETLPADFIQWGMSARHTTRASHASATGFTEYIGSPHSDRRARVYRYTAPHPRSAFLRIEVVLRRDLAKQASSRLATESVTDLWRSAAEPYDFKHPQWRFSDDIKEGLKTLRNEKTSASRLRWLVKTAIPSICDGIADGLLDRDALVAKLLELPC